MITLGSELKVLIAFFSLTERYPKLWDKEVAEVQFLSADRLDYEPLLVKLVKSVWEVKEAVRFIIVQIKVKVM